MTSKLLTSLLLAACAIAAPTEKCAGVLASPPPAGATCQTTQALKRPLGPDLISNKVIAAKIAHPFVQCGNNCAKTTGCLSFAYVNTNRACRLYKQTLSSMGLQPGTSQPDIPKYDLACFTKQCTPTVPTCTTSSVSPTLTALATPTTILAASDTGITYNVPNQDINVPWGFQLYGQTINTFSMNGFGQLVTNNGGLGIINTLGGLNPELPQAPSAAGFYSEILGAEGQRMLNLQWTMSDYEGLQQTPPLLYTWFATMYEAEPARIDFNYISLPADNTPFPYLSWAVYNGCGGTCGGRISFNQAQYTLSEGEDLTNKILTYDPTRDILTALVQVGPDGCTPGAAATGTS